jgi:hypothetical protein
MKVGQKVDRWCGNGGKKENPSPLEQSQPPEGEGEILLEVVTAPERMKQGNNYGGLTSLHFFWPLPFTSFRHSHVLSSLPQQPHPHSHAYFITTSIPDPLFVTRHAHCRPFLSFTLSITHLFVPFSLCVPLSFFLSLFLPLIRHRSSLSLSWSHRCDTQLK